MTMVDDLNQRGLEDDLAVVMLQSSSLKRKSERRTGRANKKTGYEKPGPA
jgi:hypothetical protein